MPLDSGILTVWRGINNSPPGSMPVMQYHQICQEYYGEQTVGITRWYTAQQHGDRPDIVAQIPRRYDLKVGTDRVTLAPFAYVDSGSYKINQIQQVISPENLPMTNLTLERDDGIDANDITSAATTENGIGGTD